MVSSQVSNRQLSNRHINSEHHLKEVLTNGDHLKLKTKLDAVVNKWMSTPSSGHSPTPGPFNIPKKTLSSFPPEPGENRDSIDLGNTQGGVIVNMGYDEGAMHMDVQGERPIS